MRQAVISAIATALPEHVLGNEELASIYPGWTAEKIQEKTGIVHRHVASHGTCSSDLAVAAAERLFSEHSVERTAVDYVLFCTQTPDYVLPTTACLIQNRLGLRQQSGALDFNLGCSGYIYGLGLARGLLETGQAERVLLLTADTYTRLIHPRDRSVRTLFGDAGTATLLVHEEVDSGPRVGPFVFGTDGRGADNLIVPAGGFRRPRTTDDDVEDTDGSGNTRTPSNLFMNGAEIFAFAAREVPVAVNELLSRAGLLRDNVDLWVFHQASQLMLDHLRARTRIPREKFYVCLKDVGNTVSSTIPFALHAAELEGVLAPGMTVGLVGFGVGYSWGACLVRW